jgi:hypothetical protein
VVTEGAQLARRGEYFVHLSLSYAF